MYGACPKAPHGYGLSWMDAGETLKQMKLLNASLLPISDADRSNVNKFLNRLLGLPVATQNALFAYYMAVFRWVVVTAKSQGRVDSGVAMIEGDSLEQLGEPEVLFQDPATSALSELIELKVDTGLSWPSARRYLHEALRDPLVKSTEFGGTTGFWRQQRSNRLVLAVELPTSSADRSRRMHRILRPTMHTSLKPQYVPANKLKARYSVVRDEAEASIGARRQETVPARRVVTAHATPATSIERESASMPKPLPFMDWIRTV